MKKSFFLFLFLFSSGILVAQPVFNFGLKAGVNNSKLTIRTSEFTSESIVKTHIGAFGRLGWSRIYLQPEVYFSAKGGEVWDRNTNPIEKVARFDFNNVDVPVLVGVKLVNLKAANLRLMGGPVFSIMTSNNINREQIFDAQYYRNNYFGYQYGIGVDVLSFFIDARMEHGVNDVYQEPVLGINGKNQTFMVTVGFKIF